MIRVVADTNIYISALMFGGLPGLFLDLAFQRAFTLVYSGVLLDELYETLRGKFAIAKEDVQIIRGKIERTVHLVEPGLVLEAVRADPDDNRVLECAVAGKAEFVIGGDHHLLQLGSYEGIPILTVRQFLDAVALGI